MKTEKSVVDELKHTVGLGCCSMMTIMSTHDVSLNLSSLEVWMDRNLLDYGVVSVVVAVVDNAAAAAAAVVVVVVDDDVAVVVVVAAAAAAVCLVNIAAKKYHRYRKKVRLD
jgi:hypothetical protein